MEELTALFLILAFGLFVIIQFRKISTLKMLSLIVAVLSISASLIDTTLTPEQLPLVIVPSFFLFLGSLASMIDMREGRK